MLYNVFSLAVYFIHSTSSVYLSVPISPFLLGIRIFVLYIRVFISASTMSFINYYLFIFIKLLLIYKKNKVFDSLSFILKTVFFFFGPHLTACGILVLQPGIRPTPPAMWAQSLNHWTVTEVSKTIFFPFGFGVPQSWFSSYLTDCSFPVSFIKSDLSLQHLKSPGAQSLTFFIYIP